MHHAYVFVNLLIKTIVTRLTSTPTTLTTKASLTWPSRGLALPMPVTVCILVFQLFCRRQM